jgi:hypothetical protein
MKQGGVMVWYFGDVGWYTTRMEDMHNTERSEEIAALRALAEKEIARIEQLPQPVVRVCGPLTCDGPAGYERNAARLADAERILQSKGMTVWTFGEAEAEIYGRGYDNQNIFDYFHKTVLESGLITEAYFLPRSNESHGATLERTTAAQAGVATKEFTEDMFSLESNS